MLWSIKAEMIVKVTSPPSPSPSPSPAPCGLPMPVYHGLELGGKPAPKTEVEEITTPIPLCRRRSKHTKQKFIMLSSLVACKARSLGQFISYTGGLCKIDSRVQMLYHSEDFLLRASLLPVASHVNGTISTARRHIWWPVPHRWFEARA